MKWKLSSEPQNSDVFVFRGSLIVPADSVGGIVRSNLRVMKMSKRKEGELNVRNLLLIFAGRAAPVQVKKIKLNVWLFPGACK